MPHYSFEIKDAMAVPNAVQMLKTMNLSLLDCQKIGLEAAKNGRLDIFAWVLPKITTTFTHPELAIAAVQKQQQEVFQHLISHVEFNTDPTTIVGWIRAGRGKQMLMDMWSRHQTTPFQFSNEFEDAALKTILSWDDVELLAVVHAKLGERAMELNYYKHASKHNSLKSLYYMNNHMPLSNKRWKMAVWEAIEHKHPTMLRFLFERTPEGSVDLIDKMATELFNKVLSVRSKSQEALAAQKKFVDILIEFVSTAALEHSLRYVKTVGPEHKQQILELHALRQNKAISEALDMGTILAVPTTSKRKI